MARSGTSDSSIAVALAPEHTRMLRVQVAMALACILIAVLAGFIAAFHYTVSASQQLNGAGLTMTKLRPIHTTFVSLWIFGAAIAVVYHFLMSRDGGLSRGDVRRFWFHTGCWILAGLGVFATLLMGISSGREYLGFHPVFSLFFVAGWLAFAVNYFRQARHDFFAQPIYVYFWGVGILFFLYTFTEGHAWLLSFVRESPVRDLQVQWKSCGTLVGSFNFLVYGSLVYVTERITGDRRYGQSPLAFSLFFVGCLNSFTNYAHHTYHLPQSHAVKWIAFVVSMAEVIILLVMLRDIARALRGSASTGTPHPAFGFLKSAKWWTTIMLFVSLVISVPSLNSIIHGTHVVTGHAMGTELGIDTLVLFGAVTFLLAGTGVRPGIAANGMQAGLSRLCCYRNLLLLNVSMAAMVGWLVASGATHGYYRFIGESSPEWISWVRFVLPASGGVLALALLGFGGRWLWMLRQPPDPLDHAAPAPGEPA